MANYKHVITFLSNAQKFANTSTSDLMVDRNNTVDDVMKCADTTGGLIADIDNSIGEIKILLEEYYKKTDNKTLLGRLRNHIK